MRTVSLITFFLFICNSSFGADQVRLLGNVHLYDKLKSPLPVSDIQKIIDSGVSTQVSLDPQHPNQPFWLLDENELPLGYDGKWQTFASYNGNESERQIPMIGKVGNYFSTEPTLIRCNPSQALCYGTLTLRSPSNAAAWKFNACTRSIREGQTPTATTISCLMEAKQYSKKEVIDLQLADIYSQEQQYEECFLSFDSVAKSTTSDTIRESAIANASDCREEAALLEQPKTKKYELLSEYIRIAFNNDQVTKTNSRVRQMLLRRWFDAFNMRLAPTGDLELLISKTTENNELHKELTEIYEYYFWGNSKLNFTGQTNEEKIKGKIKALAQQWGRHYQ